MGSDEEGKRPHAGQASRARLSRARRTHSRRCAHSIKGRDDVDPTRGSQQGWTLGQFGTRCAYVQVEGLGRSLLLRMPDPAPPRTIPGEVVAATGAIYGTKNAGRKWYFHLKNCLAKHDIMNSSLGKKGFYRLVGEHGLELVMHTHVYQ